MPLMFRVIGNALYPVGKETPMIANVDKYRQWCQ